MIILEGQKLANFSASTGILFFVKASRDHVIEASKGNTKIRQESIRRISGWHAFLVLSRRFAGVRGDPGTGRRRKGGTLSTDSEFFLSFVFKRMAFLVDYFCAWRTTHHTTVRLQVLLLVYNNPDLGLDAAVARSNTADLHTQRCSETSFRARGCAGASSRIRLDARDTSSTARTV